MTDARSSSTLQARSMGRVDLCPRARTLPTSVESPRLPRVQRSRCRAHGTSNDHHRVTRSRLTRHALLSLLAGSTLSRGSLALAEDGDKIEDIKKLVRYSEKNYGDPETNVDLLEQAIAKSDALLASGALEGEPEASAALISSLILRGNAFLLLKEWESAEKDFRRAGEVIAANPSLGEDYSRKEGGFVYKSSRQKALALSLDGLGLSLSQGGRWGEAEEVFAKNLGILAKYGATAEDGGPLINEEVPTGWALSGLRGGPPTLYQRAQLSLALAKYANDNPRGALSVLEETDKGPDPGDLGFPQFWDARAAQVAVLYSNGYKGKAELEWRRLCLSHPPPPPSVPKNKVKQYVNRAAQKMLDVEGALTNNNCEDFDSGLGIPCDDAGIPGLGGSSSPCVLYTEEEVTIRMWPKALVNSFVQFKGDVLA